MTTDVINPKGVTQGRFSRVEEYNIFCFAPNAFVADGSDNLLNPPEEKKYPRWKGLLRSGTDALRTDRENMFYPVFIDKTINKVVGAGEALPLGVDPDVEAEVDGYSVAWPIREDGSWGRWSVGADTLRTLIEKGYVSCGRYDRKRKTWGLSYISQPNQRLIDEGKLVITSRDPITNVVVVEYASSENRVVKTVWHNETMKFKYEEALHKNRPYINHEFKLESGKYMELMIGGTKAVIVALPLRDCIKIPGIKDGSLFRKNVRQSLGNSNKVNKGIAKTIKTDAEDFFFLHNGITAICSQMSIHDGVLSVKELNVVNGCQSLSTIFSSSEAAKKATDAYILFRFYEIEDQDRADRISTSTNSQSAVKARDLRSNDKAVLAMKRAYEQYFPDGYFVTKRGERVDTVKYNTAHVVNLTDLGKQLIAWHSQRPTISYSETKIFDKYFDQLFHRDYAPENVQALNVMFAAVYEKWGKENPMGLNETLLAMKAYAPYHQLFAIRRSRKQVTMDLSPKRTGRVETTAYFTFFLRWYYIVAKELY